MLSAIDYDGPNSLLITGCPGSGKTTVSLMRAERLINMKKKVLLITYQDLLKKSLVNISSDDLKPNIVKFFAWYVGKFNQRVDSKDETIMIKEMKDWTGCDEIIIDEGQDFESRIYRALLEKCKKITVGADDAQKVHNRGLNATDIKIEVQKKYQLTPVHLQYNYRNTFEIFDFAKHFLPDNERANNKLTSDRLPKGNGVKPSVFLVPDDNTQLSQLKTILLDGGDKNIAVLVYYAEEVEYYAKEIRNMGINCTTHHHDNHANGHNIENVIVTTFKSAKGLEFQIVVMPNMETAGNKHYMTPEHYYIGCTRAKENLYLIIKEDVIPDYLTKFDSKTFQLLKVPKLANPVGNNLIDDLPF
jgi:superfamily I DNA/RNA helicase